MTTEDMNPEERIDNYLLGLATAEEVEALNELLAKDEQLRKLYRFRVAIEGGYREAVIRDGVSGLESVGRALLPVIDGTASNQTGRSARSTVESRQWGWRLLSMAECLFRKTTRTNATQTTRDRIPIGSSFYGHGHGQRRNCG